MNSFDFRIGSLNVRGINKHSKRTSIFNWVKSQGFDIMLLQETFSSNEDENLWQTEWGGQTFWSHGSKHSRGVGILIKRGFDFEMLKTELDPEGRYILMKARVQGEALNIINIYVPNVEKDKNIFFRSLNNTILSNEIDINDPLLIAGDWNTILDPSIDKTGGKTIISDSVGPEMRNLINNFELVDVWRDQNPNTRRYTYRQRKPLIQSRLDYFMVSHSMIDMIEKPQILSSYCSDHSCVSLSFITIPNESRGRGLWKFNAALVEDEIYVENMNNLIDELGIKYNDIIDKRLKWELIKYEIRKFTIRYCIDKKRIEKTTLEELHLNLNILETALGNNPNDKNSEQYYSCKAQIDKIEEDRAHGAIVRSKIDWIEKGEKSTRFFFDMEKYNYNKKHIRKLKVDSNTTITNSNTITNETVRFYEQLYASSMVLNDNDHVFFTNDIPKLTPEQQIICDSDISEAECYKTLCSFKDSKTPGNDGLTKAFYVTFWRKLSTPLLECYDFSFLNGCMSTSQRQAVITLIEKSGKDRNLLSNWRPISLLNYDYKILTKVLANRVKQFLPYIISESQTGYVKERNIEDSIRLIQDVIHYLDTNNLPGILLAIDFQKAFDTIEWEFLLKALKHFNFGQNFIKWIELLYTDISSCTINNNKTSQYFNIKRGVRQGDPLSPYLFIIAVELLARAIKRSEDISGIHINVREIKMTQYADDLTIFLDKPESIPNLLDLLEIFGQCSGLRINKEKTEALALGSLKGHSRISSKVKFVKSFNQNLRHSYFKQLK